MKNSLLFFCLICIGHFASAQISAVVQQTWHLRSISIGNTIHYIPLGEAIQLNFNGVDPNYELTTNGIENEFSANAHFNNDNLNLSNVDITSANCNAPNCDFENLYFYELLSDQILSDKTFTYFYMVFSNGRKMLRLTDSNGNSARFFDIPLASISETLFREWYLHSMDVDLGDPSFIEDYDPPIFPNLIIHPDLSFTGAGSCNNFSGIFDYTVDPYDRMILIPKDFQATTDPCEFHMDFENYYFEQFQYGESLYTELWTDPTSGDSYFSFEMYAGFYFNFASYPILSAPDVNKNYFAIYPNPVSEELFIESSTSISSITVTDINGRVVKALENPTSNQIEVSVLNPGIYFLILQSSEGSITKKFIKH